MNSQAKRTTAKSVMNIGILVAASALSAGLVYAQDFSVNWHTIDGGGEVLSETADQTWQLSGTIGQPDSTESLDLSGNGWTLTGGFWPVMVDQTNILFKDGFEGESASRRDPHKTDD